MDAPKSLKNSAFREKDEIQPKETAASASGSTLFNLDSFRRPGTTSQNGEQETPKRSIAIDAFRRPGSSAKPTRRQTPRVVRPAQRSKRIERIREDDAERMRAGQTLGDVRAVTKELLENALDAGATRIEVSLRGVGGVEGVAVSDDGRGVREEDFGELCMAGSTSKAARGETFGFRGAALAAVCATCRSVRVITRAQGVRAAVALNYTPRGVLESQTPAARPQGTTVDARGIFHALPVRRAHAVRHAARETTRVVSLSQAYALVSTRTRIELRVDRSTRLCYVPLARKRSACAQGPPVAPGDLDLVALRHSVTSVLGRRVLLNLVDFQKDNVGPDKGVTANVSGLVSSGAGGSAKGSGSGSSSSAQFVYINKRPVDMPRLVRTVNETFRRATGNPSGTPSFIFNLSIDPKAVDVNLAPDKRAVLCENEPAIVNALADNLEKMWAPTDANHIALQNADLRNMFKSSPLSEKLNSNSIVSRDHPKSISMVDESQEIEPQSSHMQSAKRNIMHDIEFAEETETANLDALSTPRRVPIELGEPQDVATNNEYASTPRCAGDSEMRDRVEDLDSAPVRRTPRKRIRVDNYQADDEEETEIADGEQAEDSEYVRLSRADITYPVTSSTPRLRTISTSGMRYVGRQGKRITNKDISVLLAKRGVQLASHQRQAIDDDISIPPHPAITIGRDPVRKPDSSERKEIEEQPLPTLPNPAVREVYDSENTHGRVFPKENAREMCWDTLLDNDVPDSFEDLLPDVAVDASMFRHASVSGQQGLNHLSGESDAQQVVAAEEMTKEFRQEWFREMRVVGQFNLGFIVCALGQELFIVDQHASDEKRNFEELRCAPVATQRLVAPLPLPLSAEDELLVMEHERAFSAGGFRLRYRPDRNPTQRVLLLSQPAAARGGASAFVLDDIADIVARIKSCPPRKGEVLRPPRSRALIASQACRRSVMVGDPLDCTNMRRIVSNLSGLTHPWTCPHGRPTMRHLGTLG